MIDTVEGLLSHFHATYGITERWPNQFEVSAELYGRVCQTIIDKEKRDRDLYFHWDGFENRVSIAIGPNNGIIFKNVELIIKRET